MRRPASALGSLTLLVAVVACPDRSPTGECATNQDCRAEELCVAGHCRTTCNADRDCSGKEQCDDGVCLERPSSDGAARPDATLHDTLLLDATQVDRRAPDSAASDGAVADAPPQDRVGLDHAVHDAGDDAALADAARPDLATAEPDASADAASLSDVAGAADTVAPVDAATAADTTAAADNPIAGDTATANDTATASDSATSADTATAGDVETMPDAPVADDGAFVDDAALVPDASIPEDWWETEWQRRRQISFSAPASSDLPPVPVLVVLQPTRIDYDAETCNGDDLAFVDSNGGVLPHEVEAWQDGGPSYVWVALPPTSVATTPRFWMYYASRNCASPPVTSVPVWAPQHVAVWHLRESGSGAAAEFKDSTSNNNHGQGGSGVTTAVPLRSPGAVGLGQRFDGNTQHIAGPSAGSVNVTGSSITLEAWVRPEPNPTAEGWGIVSKGGSTGAYRLELTPAMTVHFQLGDKGEETSTTTVPLGAWAYVVATYSGSRVTIYLNGLAVTDAARSWGTLNSTTDAVWIGHGNDQAGQVWAHPFTGGIDEVRISNVARSATWVEVQYRSMTDALLSYGPDEVIP